MNSWFLRSFFHFSPSFTIILLDHSLWIAIQSAVVVFHFIACLNEVFPFIACLFDIYTRMEWRIERRKKMTSFCFIIITITFYMSHLLLFFPFQFWIRCAVWYGGARGVRTKKTVKQGANECRRTEELYWWCNPTCINSTAKYNTQRVS